MVSLIEQTCIETAESFDACRAFDVHLFQGNLLRPTTVLDHAAAGLSPRRR